MVHQGIQESRQLEQHQLSVSHDRPVYLHVSLATMSAARDNNDLLCLPGELTVPLLSRQALATGTVVVGCRKISRQRKKIERLSKNVGSRWKSLEVVGWFLDAG